jgi:hypothetical protein
MASFCGPGPQQEVSMSRGAVFKVAVALAGLFGAVAAAREPGLEDTPPAEARTIPYLGLVPACDDESVLWKLQREFEGRESGYWGSGLAIVNFTEARELGYRSKGASYIPRRYCRATATLNDGRERAVNYEIAEALGFIGIDFGLTWCVTGLDRNHAFSPDCKAAGP